MLKVALICGNNEYIKIINSKIKETVKTNYKVSYFNDSDSFIKEITYNQIKYDIIVFDLYFENAIEVVSKVNYLLPFSLIIYIGDREEYSNDIYITKHIFYVFKENIEYDILKAFEIANEIIKKYRDNTLCISFNKIKKNLLQSKIIFIERENRISMIHTTTGIYKTTKKMDDLYSKLNDSFCICHKSFIVNLNFISKINSNYTIVLSNGCTIPISRARKDEFMDRYNYHTATSGGGIITD